MFRKGRRKFFKWSAIGLLTLCASQLAALARKVGIRTENRRIYFTTGFKVMEVSHDEATVWTRVCHQEHRNPVRHERREQVFRHPIGFDENQRIDGMDGAVRCGEGLVKLTLVHDGKAQSSDWIRATAETDFTVSFSFRNLKPASAYEVRIQGSFSSDGPISSETGTFRTLPSPSAVRDVSLVTSTCQYFWSFDDAVRGFRTYDSMRKLKPDLFIHTGDYVYYDKPGPIGNTVARARHQWHAMDSWPSIREFYAATPVYMMKDDHDLLKDDAYPGMGPYGRLSFEDGLKIWYENVPLRSKPYRTIRYGRNLQIWMVEGREYRSPNNAVDGADKSIWGDEQKKWLTKSVGESDATFKILFSATPVVGPDRETKKDNHANKVFQTEGVWLRNYLSAHKNFFVVNGDRHWQYVSKDPLTGLVEFGSGPVSDYHAQGWDPDDVRPEHSFLRVKGGFLQVTIGEEAQVAVIKFIHRDVDGNVVNEAKYFS